MIQYDIMFAMVAERKIVIEEVSKLNPNALRSTVVRWQDVVNDGVWVSTVPNLTTFRTQAFRFSGYPQRLGKVAIPDFINQELPSLNRWVRTHEEPADVERIIEYHELAVNEIATMLEDGELPPFTTTRNSIV